MIFFFVGGTENLWGAPPGLLVATPLSLESNIFCIHVTFQMHQFKGIFIFIHDQFTVRV